MSCGFGVLECSGYGVHHDVVKFFMLGGMGGALTNGFECRIGLATFVRLPLTSTLGDANMGNRVIGWAGVMLQIYYCQQDEVCLYKALWFGIPIVV